MQKIYIYIVDCHVDFWCSNLVQTMKATCVWSWKSTTVAPLSWSLQVPGRRCQREGQNLHFWPWTQDDTGWHRSQKWLKNRMLTSARCLFFCNFRHLQCLFFYMFLGAAVRITPNGGFVWWPLPARKPWKIGSNNWCLGDEILSWMFIRSPERSGLVIWIMSILRYSKNKKNII